MNIFGRKRIICKNLKVKEMIQFVREKLGHKKWKNWTKVAIVYVVVR